MQMYYDTELNCRMYTAIFTELSLHSLHRISDPLMSKKLIFCFLLFCCLDFMAHLLAQFKSLWLQHYVLIPKKPFPGFLKYFFSEIVFHLCTIFKNIRSSICCRKFGVSDIWHSYIMKPFFQSPAMDSTE